MLCVGYDEMGVEQMGCCAKGVAQRRERSVQGYDETMSKRDGDRN